MDGVFVPENVANPFSAASVPDLGGCVVAARQGQLTVRRERHSEDRPGMLFCECDRSPSFRVPYLDRSIERSDQDVTTVGRKDGNWSPLGNNGLQTARGRGSLRYRANCVFAPCFTAWGLSAAIARLCVILSNPRCRLPESGSLDSLSCIDQPQ